MTSKLTLSKSTSGRQWIARVLAMVAVLFIVIPISLDIKSASRGTGGIESVGLDGLVLHCLAVILLLVSIFLDGHLKTWREQKQQEVMNQDKLVMDMWMTGGANDRQGDLSRD